jgi:hypothetical protein
VWLTIFFFFFVDEQAEAERLVQAAVNAKPTINDEDMGGNNNNNNGNASVDTDTSTERSMKTSSE